MLKTTLIASAVLLGVAAPPAQISEGLPAAAEQTLLIIPPAETVIAQLSYLEISHGAAGFDFSVTDTTAVFVDIGFPGDLHIRIGF